MNHRTTRLARSGVVALITLFLSAAGFPGHLLAAEDLFHEEFLPPAGKGPAVLVISGQTGPDPRRAYAKEIAKRGYYVLLVDGQDILSLARGGEANFSRFLNEITASPRSTSAAAAVIGFSLGGGGVLAHASHRADKVSVGIAYYPATNWMTNPDWTIKRFSLPILMFAGTFDDYMGCCLIGKAREIRLKALELGKSFELVEYKAADHAFDLPGALYKGAYTADALEKTLGALKRHHALP